MGSRVRSRVARLLQHLKGVRDRREKSQQEVDQVDKSRAVT